MDFFYYEAQLMTCLLEMGLFYYWMNGFAQTRRMKNIWKICTFFVVMIPCYGAGFLSDTLIGMALGCICLFIMGAVLFKGKLRMALFYTFLFFVTEFAIEILLESLGGFVWYVLLGKALQFLFVFFAIKWAHPVKAYYGTRDYRLFCLAPVGVFILLLAVYLSGIGSDGSTDIQGVEFSFGRLFLILGSIAAVFVNIVIVYMIEDAARLVEENKRLEILSVRTELEKKHYEEMERMHQQYDIYMHDVRRMVRTVMELAYNEKWENARTLADEMLDSLYDIRKNSLCIYDVLN